MSTFSARYLLSPVEQPLATGFRTEMLNKALSDFFYFGEFADPRDSGTAPVHRSDLNPHLGFESPAKSMAEQDSRLTVNSMEQV